MTDIPNFHGADPNPAQPLRKTCPSCRYVHAEEKTQCDQCGLIFEKWRDPKARQADAKLAAIAEKSSGGFPKSLAFILFFLVAFPVALFVVPDLETRVIGAKLRYRPSLNQEATFQTDTNLRIGSGLTNFSAQGKLSVLVTDKDSGNNNTYTTTFSEFFINGLSKSDAPAARTDLSAWNENAVRGSLGNEISMMNSMANDLRRNIQQMQKLNMMRAEQMQRAQFGGFFFNDSNVESGSTYKSAESAQMVADSLTKGQIELMNLSFFFRYPKERVKKGDFFTQDLKGMLIGRPWGLWFPGEKIKIQVDGAERRPEGFCVLVSWNTKVHPSFNNMDEIFKKLINSTNPEATYSGTAAIRYRDGFIQELDGTIDVPLDISGNNLPVVIGLLGGTATDANPIHLVAKQKFKRL